MRDTTDREQSLPDRLGGGHHMPSRHTAAKYRNTTKAMCHAAWLGAALAC